MKPILALAAVIIAAATLWWVTFRHQHREYRWPVIIPPDPVAQSLIESEDGVQPFDPRTAATGLAAA